VRGGREGKLPAPFGWEGKKGGQTCGGLEESKERGQSKSRGQQEKKKQSTFWIFRGTTKGEEKRGEKEVDVPMAPAGEKKKEKAQQRSSWL